ncbi:MAG: hypothetical protein GXP62_16005 [Oligoflexia bacterium]|nr:hypothetical protein [Oligoflexia bacterium]
MIIIHQGRIVAQDRIENLAQGGAARLRVLNPGAEADAALCAVNGVAAVHAEPNGVFRVEATQDAASPDSLRTALAAAAVPFGLIELGAAHGLEDAYLRLTADSEPDTRDGSQFPSSTPKPQPDA